MAKFDHELMRRLREAKGLSRTQLAGLVGVTEAAVRNWESGNREPTGVLLVKLAEVLEIHPGKLVTDAA